MFKYKKVQDQLREEKAKNEQLKAALRKNEADTEYIAMMCDVELESDKEEQEVMKNE